MSIISGMKPYTLQYKEVTQSLTGAKKEVWKGLKTIYVNVSKNDANLNIQSVKADISSHTGITFYKALKEYNNRLVSEDNTIYDITNCYSKGRYMTLLLKEVDIDV